MTSFVFGRFPVVGRVRFVSGIEIVGRGFEKMGLHVVAEGAFKETIVIPHHTSGGDFIKSLEQIVVALVMR